MALSEQEVFRDGQDEAEEPRDFTYAEVLAVTFKRKTAVEHEDLLRATFSTFGKNADGRSRSRS